MLSNSFFFCSKFSEDQEKQFSRSLAQSLQRPKFRAGVSELSCIALVIIDEATASLAEFVEQHRNASRINIIDRRFLAQRIHAEMVWGMARTSLFSERDT